MVNHTTIRIDPTSYIPSEQCFDWAIQQHITHSNNLEVYAMFFPLGAYLMILAYYTAKEYDSKYQDAFIYLAKILLILFFAVYILFIRLQIPMIWNIT